MKFSELWALSGKIYREVSFQSVFSLRAGSALPQGGRRDIRQLVKSSQVSTFVSKLVTTLFIAFFGFVVFLPASANTSTTGPMKELAIVGSVSAYLAVVLFLIVFLGLQVSTSFVSSKVTDILSPLPLSKKDVSSIVFLCFIRIFDIPLITAVAVFLTAYFLVGGSILGGSLSLVSIVVTEIFALALTVGSAKFFYSRVAGAGGRSKWQTFLRFAFMIVWILPTFAAYFIVNFAVNIVQSFADFAQSFSSLMQILTVAYPFSYGFLISYATFSQSIDLPSLGLSVAACGVYVLIAYYCLRWVIQSVRKIGGTAVIARFRETVRDTLIKPQIPWLGIIRKDLRVASRAPSYASLFLLPAIQTAILAVSFSSFSSIGLSTTLGLLTGISMITLLLPPTLLSIEGLASAYTRSLPLRRRTLITAKTLLSTVTYIISLIVLLIASVFLGKDPSTVLIFGGMHAFSVAAAVMLELAILARKYWKEGFAVGNLYARLTTYIMILIPGYVLASVPMIAALVTFFVANTLTPLVFLAVALAEFAVMTTIVALEK